MWVWNGSAIKIWSETAYPNGFVEHSSISISISTRSDNNNKKKYQQKHAIYSYLVFFVWINAYLFGHKELSSKI